MTIFQEAILKQYGICNNCFRRTHDVETNWFAPSRRGTTSSGMFQNPRAFHRDETTRADYIRTQESTSQKTYSCECGSMDGKAMGNPESSKYTLLVDMIRELEDRLYEEGVPVDEDTLYEVAKYHKESQSSEFVTDHEVLEEAVKESSDMSFSDYLAEKQKRIDEQQEY